MIANHCSLLDSMSKEHAPTESPTFSPTWTPTLSPMLATAEVLLVSLSSVTSIKNAKES